MFFKDIVTVKALTVERKVVCGYGRRIGENSFDIIEAFDEDGNILPEGSPMWLEVRSIFRCMFDEMDEY